MPHGFFQHQSWSIWSACSLALALRAAELPRSASFCAVRGSHFPVLLFILDPLLTQPDHGAPDLWRKRPGFEPRPITDSPAVWTCTNHALFPILGFPTCPMRQLTGWSGRTLSWKITAHPKAHCHRVLRGTVTESCLETQVGLQPKVGPEWMEGQSHGSEGTQVRPGAFTSPGH